MNKPNNIRILYQDEHLVLIEKPAGFQVHTPVDLAMQGKVVRKNNVMILLRKQLGKEIFTVHRLDKATAGVMVFAFSSEAARKMQQLFLQGTVRKTYVAVVRGWTNDSGVIDKPLSKNLDDGAMLDSLTEYETLYRFEIPYSSGGRYERERYSMVLVSPKTGRMHQIRRHFKSISHPLVGDTIHGDGRHNRLWRELLADKGGKVNHLLLKACLLEFKHPFTEEKLQFHAKWSGAWHRVFDLAGICIRV